MRPFLVSAVVASYISTTMADITWPEYSQQCQDDAGPPFMDDSETYNGGKYHDGSSASPVLIDGQCAPTMTAACASRPDAKTAYLEGPIGCQGTGWYCRIVEQEGWAAGTLSGDLNFGHCNSSLSFEDWGYDRDGHCHGSSDDSTYYWWIRDHWFRGYNGRLRCCCGWYTTPSMDGAVPMYSQKIANRCDYRRLVTKTEDVSTCRDANEDHGLGFDDIGCDTSLESAQTGSPVPDNDATCWEIHNFGVGSEAYEESSESLEMAQNITVIVVIVLLSMVFVCIGAFCWWKRSNLKDQVKIRDAIQMQQQQQVPTGTGAEEAEPTGADSIEVEVAIETEDEDGVSAHITTSTAD